MDNIHQQMFRLGIPTYIESIFTAVPAAAPLQFNIAKQMPTQIGWIYGLSIYTDGVAPDASTLITIAQAQNIFLLLKQGQENIIETIRLDDLCFTSTQNIGCDRRYFPINIWASNLSFDQSKYLNPNGYGTNNIQLNLHYISIQDRDYLRNVEYLNVDAMPLKEYITKKGSNSL